MSSRLVQIVELRVDAAQKRFHHVVTERERESHSLHAAYLVSLALVVVDHVQAWQTTVPIVQIAHRLLFVRAAHNRGEYVRIAAFQALMKAVNVRTTLVISWLTFYFVLYEMV
jgi:hypothetical protein